MSKTHENVHEIRAIVVEALAAWQHRDVAAFVGFFTEDVEYVDVVGQRIVGSAALEEYVTRLWRSFLKEGTLHIKDIVVNAIHPDVASVLVWWELADRVRPDGTPLQNQVGSFHFVVRNGSDGWRIAVSHNVDYAASYPLKSGQLPKTWTSARSDLSQSSATY